MNNQHKEAGGCISIYLVLIILGSSISIIGGVIALIQADDYWLMRSLLILWPVIVLRATIALWHWKRWGLLVQSVHFTLFIILGVLFLSATFVLSGVLGLLLIFMLYYDKINWLE